MIASWIILLVVFVISLYKYFNRNINYWNDRGVQSPKSKFFFGDYYDLIFGRKCIGKLYKDLYNQFSGSRFVGVLQFQTPNLMLRDLDDIKRVLISDFHNFQDRIALANTDADPLSNHLFNVEGKSWKPMRQMISPTFTTGKLKNMFGLIVEVADEFSKFAKKVADRGNEVDVKEMCAQFTTDVIGTCGFGLKMDSMESNDSEFRKHGKKIFDSSLARFIIMILRLYDVRLLRYFKIKRIDTETTAFFQQLIKEILVQRQQLGTAKRHDFIDLLLELKEKHQGENGSILIDEIFIASQVFIFFAAGFETSSTLMSFTLHQLAINPEVQAKVVEEITDVLKKHENKLTYESMNELPYLDMVISETQRIYPALTTLTRICTSTYKFPESKLTIEKGTNVIVPVYGIHFDPKYYPEPEKFIPERFDNATKNNINSMSFLPFGEGPRNCIGLRLGKMQTKVGLVTLLKDYNFEPSSKTPKKLTINPKAFVTSPLEDVYLKLSKRN